MMTLSSLPWMELLTALAAIMALLSFLRLRRTLQSRAVYPERQNSDAPDQKSEEIYANLLSEYFQDSGIGAAFVGEDLRVTAMNRVARVLLQRHTETEGRPLMQEVFPPDLAAMVRECWKDKLSVHGRTISVRQPGAKAPRAMTVQVLLMRDNAGQYYGVAVFLATAAQDAAADAAAQEIPSLSELNKHKHLASIGVHAAGMAHEIKNPLVALKTFAELLPSKFNDPEFRDTFSKLALNEIRRIDSIVNDLLDYAKPRKPVFAAVHPMDVLQESLAILAARIQECNIQVRQADGVGMPMVLMDLEQMRRVFLNVLLNAVEAMPRGGQLTITAALKAKAVPCVEICVADTGPGIPPMVLDKIFEPFYTTKKKGSGLGLAISKRIVEDHGGRIGFRSGTDGTVCVITVPAAESAEGRNLSSGRISKAKAAAEPKR